MNGMEKENDSREDKRLLDKLKDDVRKKQKNKLKELIKKKIIAVILPVILYMLKILIVSILVTSIISVIIGVVSDWFDSSDDEDENQKPATNTNVAVQDGTNSNAEVQSTVLKKIIAIYPSENEALKTKMISDENIAKIIGWKNKYGYSEILLIAIAFEEEIVAEPADGKVDFNSFLTDIDAKAAEWKQNNYTLSNIKDIAKSYTGGDETTDEWCNNILVKMAVISEALNK